MIEAKALTIEQLFLMGVFEPARIQRSYNWTNRECAALVDDLERAFRASDLDPDPVAAFMEQDPDEAIDGERTDASSAVDEPTEQQNTPRLALAPPPKRNAPYFLGQLVLMPRDDPASFFVFDGQQRLTTLTVLLSVLRDQMRDGDWLPLQDMLRKPDGGRARLIAPTPGGNLARISGSLGGGEEAKRYANRSPADKLLARACQTFQQKCAIWSNEKRRAFVEFLRKRVVVIATSISDRRLAEAAYQTTNTRGRPLGDDDIVKGYIVELVGRQAATLANTVAQAWENLKRDLGPNFERFIAAAVFVDNQGADDRGYAAGVMDAFEVEDGANRALMWVQSSLPKHAQAWRTLHLHFSQDPCTGVNIHLRRLSFIQWSHWVPVAMRISHRDGRAPIRFLKDMQHLERWCFVINLLGHSDARITEACGLAIAQIDKGIDPFKYRTLDHQERTGALYIPKSYKERARNNLLAPMEDVQRLGAHVRWLETLHWPESLPHEPTDDTSVEHVLPRNPSGKWTQDFPPDKIAICTDLIGNLCLLPKDLNWALGNAQHDEKRAAYLTLPDAHRSAREVAQSDIWNPVIVEDRTKILAEKAIAALKI